MGSTIDEENPALAPCSIPACRRASDRLELVAGSDLVLERRKAFGEKWGVAALYEDYQKIIQKERPDLVAVTTRGTSLLRPANRAPSRDFRGGLARGAWPRGRRSRRADPLPRKGHRLHGAGR